MLRDIVRFNSKYKYSLIIFILLFMFVGYSFLNQDLSIHGHTLISSNLWDIHFENIQVIDGSITPTEETKIVENGTKVVYNVNFKKLGDKYQFYVDIKNAGTIDAMLNEIENTLLTETQKSYFDYYVIYSDGNQLNKYDSLNAGAKRTLLVSITLKEDITLEALEASRNQTLELSLKLDYVQADDNANNELSRCTIILGNGHTVGDELLCGNNKYIVISDNEDKTVLLAKYNLDFNNLAFTDVEGGDSANIHLPFDQAWYREDDYCYEGEMGCNAYQKDYNKVFVDSSIKSYVDAYQEKLIKNNVISTNDTVRLITVDELESLGCNANDRTQVGTCTGAPDFVTSSTYWTMTPKNNINIWDVWVVSTSKELTYDMAARDSYMGLRPVIEINKKAKNDNKHDLSIISTWVWGEALEELNQNDSTRQKSIDDLLANNINQVYLSIAPEYINDYNSYLELLYANNIEVYMLYGDPHFIMETNYSGVIENNMNVISEYNSAHTSSHIEGIHYDVEFYLLNDNGYHWIDGQTDEAKNSNNRSDFIKFVRAAKEYAATKNLKVVYDLTPTINFLTFIDTDGKEKNMLDEILKNADGIVVMAYDYTPRRSLNLLMEKSHDWGSSSIIVEKTYLEKLKEKNLPVIIGQEIGVYKEGASIAKNDITTANRVLAEYKTVFGSNYKLTKEFINQMKNDIANILYNKGIRNMGIAYHHYGTYMNVK